MSTEAFTWTYPTQRTDGTPLALTDIGSAQIFDSASPGAPIGSVAGPPTAPTGSFTTGPLGAGAHSFTVVIVDTAGDSSLPSNAVTQTVAVAPPAAVTDFAGTFTA